MSEDLVIPPVNTANGVEGAFNPHPPPPPADGDVTPTLLLSPPSIVETALVNVRQDLTQENKVLKKRLPSLLDVFVFP